jgi:hypothetical protein
MPTSTPGNVTMTADGPRLVDWTGAVRAPAAFDLACGHVVLVEVLRSSSTTQRPRAYNAAAQSEYARLAGMSPAAPIFPTLMFDPRSRSDRR